MQQQIKFNCSTTNMIKLRCNKYNSIAQQQIQFKVFSLGPSPPSNPPQQAWSRHGSLQRQSWSAKHKYKMQRQPYYGLNIQNKSQGNQDLQNSSQRQPWYAKQKYEIQNAKATIICKTKIWNTKCNGNYKLQKHKSRQP